MKGAVMRAFGHLHLTLSEDWLDAALQFLDRQHFTTVVKTQERVICLVLEQFLLSDMALSVVSSSLQQFNFDPNCTRQRIPLPLIFQIRGVRDISKSTRALRNPPQEEEKEDLTGFEKMFDEDSKDVDKESPKRMLEFVLHDGRFVVRGVELSPIHLPFVFSADSAHRLSGCKVLILPPALCRNAIIFLTNDNFRIIGGECSLQSLSPPSSSVADSLPSELPQPNERMQLGKITRFLVRIEPNRT